MTIGYKVVNVVRSLYSYNTVKYCSYNETHPSRPDYLEYKLGETIVAPRNTRIFIFDSMQSASQCYSLGLSRKLFKCSYVGGVNYNGAIDECSYNSFWRWFNKTLAKKKGFKNVKCPYSVHNYSGVILTKQIKLLEEVSDREFTKAIGLHIY